MADENQTPTAADLYEPSETSEAPTVAVDPVTGKEIVYEETPELTPVGEYKEIQPQNTESNKEQGEPEQPVYIPSATTTKTHSSFTRYFFLLLIIVIVGIAASMAIRQFTGDVPSGKMLPGIVRNPSQTSAPIAVSETTDTPVSSNNAAGWRTESIDHSGGNPDVSYSLPDSVLSPICDGASCPSKGTYLPGGTRFTVSWKKNTQSKDQFSRAIVTDANGTKFTTVESILGTLPARAYTGTFTGVTTGGYRFTRMRGIMALLPDGSIVEFNHFSPVGLTTDFESDDQIFDRILTSVQTANSATEQ